MNELLELAKRNPELKKAYRDRLNKNLIDKKISRNEYNTEMQKLKKENNIIIIPKICKPKNKTRKRKVKK